MHKSEKAETLFCIPFILSFVLDVGRFSLFFFFFFFELRFNMVGARKGNLEETYSSNPIFFFFFGKYPGFCDDGAKSRIFIYSFHIIRSTLHDSFQPSFLINFTFLKRSLPFANF